MKRFFKKSVFRKAWYRLSYRQRNFIRYIYFLPQDIIDKLTGKSDTLSPPKRLIYTGSASNSKSFTEQGKHQLVLLKKYADLQPDDTVLDIGCGLGRTAIVLLDYIKNGSYDGFDVVKTGIDWCNKKIKPKHPNFNFKHVPLHNDLYTSYSQSATNFEFPYESNSFDKVFSFSVFTHMQVEEIENYFNQIHNILKINGLCFSTFFLFNDLNEEYIAERKSFGFPVKKEGFRLMDASTKSGNIAIEESFLNAMANKNGLVVEKIIHGYWKDEVRNQSKLEYQDIVIFSKKIMNETTITQKIS